MKMLLEKKNAIICGAGGAAGSAVAHAFAHRATFVSMDEAASSR